MPPQLNQNGLRQLVVDIVSAVFDGNGAVAFLFGDDGDGFAAVATQGEEKFVQFLVVGFDGFDDIFLAFLGMSQIHKGHLPGISLG